jgi:hypothetical protein
MDVPEWLKLGEKTFYFNALNTYQKSIYIALAAEMRAYSDIKERDERLRKEGVLGYLAQRLTHYEHIVPVDLYTDGGQL